MLLALDNLQVWYSIVLIYFTICTSREDVRNLRLYMNENNIFIFLFLRQSYETNPKKYWCSQGDLSNNPPVYIVYMHHAKSIIPSDCQTLDFRHSKNRRDAFFKSLIGVGTKKDYIIYRGWLPSSQYTKTLKIVQFDKKSVQLIWSTWNSFLCRLFF